MKIKYEFANETIEIEVSDEWGNIILEMDKEEYNNEKKENRRTLSLDIGFDAGGWLCSEEYDPLELLCEKEDMEELETVLSNLTKTQRDVVKAVVLEGMSLPEFARSKGISRPSVSHRLMTAKKRLKKLL